MINKIVAIQGDHPSKLNPITDTSIFLANEIQDKDYKIFYYDPKNLSVINSKVIAKGFFIELKLDKIKYFKYLSPEVTMNLSEFMFIFLRQDPPFNMNYITTTYILDLLSKATKVINNPTSVRNATEKLFTFNFSKFMPPTLVTKDLEHIQNFMETEEEIITKPLYGNGGEGIHKFNKNNFDQDILKKYLDLPIMVQRYIKEIKDGDRRLILIDGEYCGSVARIPEEGNIKANFHAGGLPRKTEFVYRDKLIVETLGPELRKNDLFFVGIDIIGNYLTEINVTSPTGIKQINILNDVNLEKTFWDKLEAKHKLV